MKKKEDKNKLVKNLGHIGSGGEAKVFIEVRKFFPGIGWDVYTTQQLACAYREDFNQSKNIGHYNFLRHSIIKKLDDFFVQQEKYDSAHIPRPLGSTNKGYIYEYVKGSGSFPWRIFEDENWVPVRLEEWSSFTGHFSATGIDFSSDITDADDARIAKNIIISQPYTFDKSLISSLWTRIDFGSRSIVMNYDKLEKYLSKNKEKLIVSLSSQRYEFLNLALQYLKKRPENMDKRDIGRLEILAGEFRISTLSHLNRRGFSSDFSRKCGIYSTQQRID